MSSENYLQLLLRHDSQDVLLFCQHFRHLRLSDASGTTSSATAANVIHAVSRLDLTAFNCDRSVRVDMALLAAAKNDEVYKLFEPAKCRACQNPRGKAWADASKRGILSEMCLGMMELDAYICTNDDCGKWVCAEGRPEGLVILSPGTEASVTLVRHLASQVAVHGNPFSQAIRTWWIAAQQRLRSGAWSSKTPGRGRRTVSCLLSVGLRLTGKNTPDWPFLCETCWDGDMIEVVTADGIWHGYLRRRPLMQYTTYADECRPDAYLLSCGSLIGSEPVRQFHAAGPDKAWGHSQGIGGREEGSSAGSGDAPTRFSHTSLPRSASQRSEGSGRGATKSSAKGLPAAIRLIPIV